MEFRVDRTKLLLTIVLVVAFAGAAPEGAALAQGSRSRTITPTQRPANISVPHAVSFREVTGRGLLVRTWINGTGPFNFAIDTGAGATVLSPQIAEEAHVSSASGASASISGISGTRAVAHPVSLQSLALGDSENYLPGKGEVIIAGGLPSDVDGLLDPTEALSPFGYTLDIPRQELSIFDARTEPVVMNSAPSDGAVVSWLRETHGRRPFVMLSTGERALLDTGSSLGLAIHDPNGEPPSAAHGVRDIGGGRIASRRIAPRNIAIGDLALQRIPTDLVSGTDPDAPVLLGLAALRPFRIRFDPLHHLIEIAPGRY
jgi:predicted aspartyl protease